MLTTSQIAEFAFGDASFFGFRWDDTDLIIFLELASASLMEWRCHWASDLKLNIRYERPDESTTANPLRRGGPLLTWDGALNLNEDERWILFLDFAHDGTLELECSKVTISPFAEHS